MSSAVLIREEEPGDADPIRHVHDLAFGSFGEGRLVDQLRVEGLFVASVIATDRSVAVGHALFSALPIERSGRSIRAAALAPVSVLPNWQGMGFGSALIRHGLELCRTRSIETVIVLGHPNYYPRFGFSWEIANRLQAPFSGPAFMAIELQPGVLAEGGVVTYPDAFSLVD